MTTVSTLLQICALSACLVTQAIPAIGEEQAGIRRALQTMDRPVSALAAQLPTEPAGQCCVLQGAAN
ncbi:hypothetical protein [Nitratireductor thuwali]|uniref:Uncharacterized protein n=1 Tax=Nitratireductor thuwali TaxID=2267699 RepID=A0ABY5MNN2_9HYPH|nr:hypothetical protein NTH_03225 [Nitratireductor thuwali]